MTRAGTGDPMLIDGRRAEVLDRHNLCDVTNLPRITASCLGDAQFKADYGTQFAYIAGAMYKGIASKDMVVALARAQLIGYLGTGGLTLAQIESNIRDIQAAVPADRSYGMNLLSDPSHADLEERTVDLFCRYGIRFVEAAAYIQMTPSLVRYRLNGIKHGPNGCIDVPHRVLAKVSRVEVATAFMQPAPKSLVQRLVYTGLLTAAEADLSQFVPMADDICVEADSGGHTDRGVASVLMPAILSLRDEMISRHSYRRKIRVGAAGGIGTPEAAAAMFVMGADFILTGSINQCTVEAGTSVSVKEILESATVHDMTYAPAGDLFELGAKVQVLKKGIFFAARANKLYELYQKYSSIDEIDEPSKRQLEDKYFKRTLDDIWEETKAYHCRDGRKTVVELERSQKQKMALIFRWYFAHTTRAAIDGKEEYRLDYQIHCGPALGAFNQWVRGTDIASWRDRHVADIARRLLDATADLLNKRFALFANATL